MGGVKLVVFDWAGTAVDFGSVAPVSAFAEVFARRAVAVTDAEARGPMGTHKKDHIRLMLRTPSVGRKWREAAGRDWSEADVEALYREVTPLQVAAAARHAEPTPGLLGCVAELRRRGVRVGATTGYFREAAAAAAGAAARLGYAPDFSVCADDVPAGRPAPWMLFRCMEALGVYPPSAVVKVGDTVYDIEEGRNAGARAVAVVDSSSEMGLTRDQFDALTSAERRSRRERVRETFRAAGADAVIDSLAELSGLLDSL